MLAPALRRNVGDSSFQNLQQGLLYALARNIAGNGRVFVLAPNLIDFVDVDDPGLRAAYVAVGCLQQLEDDVLHILADVARFGKRGRVHNCEGNVEHASQSLRQQRFSGSCRTDQHDVRLGELDAITGFLPVHEDALVVVVNRDRQLLLGLFLPDDVLVEESFHFLRLGQLVGNAGLGSGAAVVFENGVADRDALVANVGAG